MLLTTKKISGDMNEIFRRWQHFTNLLPSPENVASCPRGLILKSAAIFIFYALKFSHYNYKICQPRPQGFFSLFTLNRTFMERILVRFSVKESPGDEFTKYVSLLAESESAFEITPFSKHV